MEIKLLNHWIHPTDSLRDYGVFDGWQFAGLKPNLADVRKRVLPRMRQELNDFGGKAYPFLVEDSNQAISFLKAFVKCYRAYLRREYTEIPDFDPVTGMHNKGSLCEACLNWQKLCQYKNIRYMGW